jgi:hypothetical protein
MWVSDQGPHFKNQMMAQIQAIYGATHHFTPAHCPWSNGTVEVMMRCLIKTIKALQVELKLPRDSSKQLLPLVQHALNLTPSSKLGGKAPVTAMTQLPASNVLTAIVHDATIKEATEEQLPKWRNAHLASLATARDALHRELAETAATKRDKQRTSANSKKKSHHYITS